MTLILRDIEGFVYEEVAEMLGVNLGTVKSRLVRGRACLRQIAAGRRCPAHQRRSLTQRLSQRSDELIRIGRGGAMISILPKIACPAARRAQQHSPSISTAV
jgi:hypothetical protein